MDLLLMPKFAVAVLMSYQMWLQTSFFFCYMGMIFYAFFLMLGAVGYRASLTFVRHIYRCGSLFDSQGLFFREPSIAYGLFYVFAETRE
jgi:hypothetical protein